MGRNRKLWTYNVDLESIPTFLVDVIGSGVDIKLAVIAPDEGAALVTAGDRYPDQKCIVVARIFRTKINKTYGPIN